jgi:hypothetical protein
VRLSANRPFPLFNIVYDPWNWGQAKKEEEKKGTNLKKVLNWLFVPLNGAYTESYVLAQLNSGKPLLF